MVKWKNGGMGEWWNERMAEWKNGGIIEWWDGGMTKACSRMTENLIIINWSMHVGTAVIVTVVYHLLQ